MIRLKKMHATFSKDKLQNQTNIIVACIFPCLVPAVTAICLKYSNSDWLIIVLFVSVAIIGQGNYVGLVFKHLIENFSFT